MSPGIRNVHALRDLGFAARWLIYHDRGPYAGLYRLARYNERRLDTRFAWLDRVDWMPCDARAPLRTIERWVPLFAYQKQLP